MGDLGRLNAIFTFKAFATPTLVSQILTLWIKTDGRFVSVNKLVKILSFMCWFRVFSRF